MRDVDAGFEARLENGLACGRLDHHVVDCDSIPVYSAAAFSPAIRPVFSVNHMVLPGRMKG